MLSIYVWFAVAVIFYVGKNSSFNTLVGTLWNGRMLVDGKTLLPATHCHTGYFATEQNRNTRIRRKSSSNTV
jgi:hypothetical protein